MRAGVGGRCFHLFRVFFKTTLIDSSRLLMRKRPHSTD